MEQIIREWSETDGWQYMIDEDGFIFRSPINSFGMWEAVEWNHTLHTYQKIGYLRQTMYENK